MNISDFLARLERVKDNGQNKWVACCPGHKDKSPSLAIMLGDQGKIIIHCFAGCSIQEVCHSINIKLSDLFTLNQNENIKKEFSKDIFISQKQKDEILLRCWYAAIFLSAINNGELIKDYEARRFNVTWNNLRYEDYPKLIKCNEQTLIKKIEYLIELRKKYI